MSLTGALSSAVSALNAQSQAIAMVSDNIANASTYGYKTVTASFESLLTGSASTSAYSSGGVGVTARYNISEQGLLTASTNTTAVAISGNGFFCVSTTGGAVAYTRNGDFTVDDDGLLVNNGNTLLGWPTDADGNVTGGESVASLQKIDTSVRQSIAAATTTETIKANLPADADTGDTFTSTLEVYDALGTASNVVVTWTKTADNAWSATFGNPTLATDASRSTGTVTSGTSIAITFNSDGTLASTSPSPATLPITWSTGAGTSSITVSLGTAGSADGLTQYTSDTDPASVTLKSITQDGLAYGSLTGVSIADGGNVTAKYSNGQTLVIYKVAVATFANPNGLTPQTGGLYAGSIESGSVSVHEAGTGGAGAVFGSELEASRTDTTTEFSTMITAQQAYSAAAQVISTVSEMYDTLMSAVR